MSITFISNFNENMGSVLSNFITEVSVSAEF